MFYFMFPVSFTHLAWSLMSFVTAHITLPFPWWSHLWCYPCVDTFQLNVSWFCFSPVFVVMFGYPAFLAAPFAPVRSCKLYILLWELLLPPLSVLHLGLLSLWREVYQNLTRNVIEQLRHYGPSRHYLFEALEGRHGVWAYFDQMLDFKPWLRPEPLFGGIWVAVMAPEGMARTITPGYQYYY